MARRKFKTIGVLTSGGDAPGMNLAVRAVTRRALDNGLKVYGILGGYYGLIHDKMKELSETDVSNIENIGGTILWSDRCDEFKTEEGMQKAIATCKKHHIDAIVAIGGDGTFRGATDLSVHGIPTVGVPGSIDNDITSSDYTIGFDTAMNTVTECIDKLRDTCESHARLNIVEVMGRDCGEIALKTGIASGAMGIVIPEHDFDEDACIARMEYARSIGKRSMLIVVSEGCFTADGTPYGEYLQKKLSAAYKAGTFCAEPKFARLAHLCRGGTPTLRDRLTASEMGAYAVDMLLAGKSDAVVIERDGKLCSHEITSALVNDKMYKKKLKEGALDGYSEKQIAKMQALCDFRKSEIDRLYEIHLSLCIGK